MKRGMFYILILLTAVTLPADPKRVIGTGPNGKVLHKDIAGANPGDWIENWRGLGKPYYLVPGDITWSLAHLEVVVEKSFMDGFSPALPDIDDSGEKYVEYKMTDAHTRKVYENGGFEDTITKNSEFAAAFAEFQQTWSQPIPRYNSTITGAGRNWYYAKPEELPGDFPRDVFWAAISFEGRIMKVVVANMDPSRPLAVSYWATADFMRDYPHATWTWRPGAVDARPSGGRVIQESVDPSQVFYEYNN